MSKLFLFASCLLIVLTAFAFTPGLTYASSGCPKTPSTSQQQVLSGTGAAGNDCSSGKSGVNNLLSTVVNILSVITGAVAIIMIIVGGFRYITSGGDSGKVGSAKNTLIYAVIGLAIVALAQLIVTLTVGNATNLNCPSGQHYDSSTQACVANH